MKFVQEIRTNIEYGLFPYVRISKWD